jgi:chromate transporter
MARYFSRVALVNVGGAYAVLPAVARSAVEQFGWLTSAEMVDGLALGETTPGPRIIVVVFVGVLGGWQATSSLIYSLLAGLVVVWFTFLPSFLFILAGAPLLEWSRTEGWLAGPMAAIGAAVVALVALVASLAVVLGQPVLWPNGLAAAPSPAALILVVVGLALLVRGWGGLRLVGLAAAVGLVRFALAGAGRP